MAITKAVANTSENSNTETKVNKNWFDGLARHFQLTILASGVFLFFGLHQILQEAIMTTPGFQASGILLGYLEVLGVTICSFVERTFLSKERGRVAPLRSYPSITLCLMTSASFSNLALNYINVPTKVVFRSCKLLPTMIIATVINKRIFTCVEYVCAVAICCGLICFGAADWKLSPTFNFMGITLVSLSVCADSMLPNAQEKLFQMGASRLEVTLYSNAFTLLAMTCWTTLLSGDLLRIIKEIHVQDEDDPNHTMAKLLLLYTFVFYAAVSAFMHVVKRFGGVTAVLIATARKLVTIVMSFIFFPKPFSWLYVLGSILVLGGLVFSSVVKKGNNKNRNNQHSYGQKIADSSETKSSGHLELGSNVATSS